MQHEGAAELTDLARAIYERTQGKPADTDNAEARELCQRYRLPKERAEVIVKQVREEVLNVDTGTTFLLTEKGLFLIRRPAMEWNRSWREREWFIAHNGG